MRKAAAVPRVVQEYLRTLIVDAQKLTVTEAAERLNITRPSLSNVLHGHAALSPELALRIERVFGVDARTLLIEQLDEVLEEARRNGETVPRNPD